MTDSYVAWNGENYPWPPPDGWEEKADGRYWPADSAPVLDTDRPVSPPPSEPQAAPAPQWQPPPAAQQAPPPSYQPPPSVTPMAGVPYVPPEKKTSGAKKVLIGLLIALVVLVGGCVATITVGGLVFGNRIENAVEDFVDAQEEAANQTSLDLDTCTDRDGRSVVEVTVENTSGGTSDYFITLRFLGPAGEIATAELEMARVDPGETRTAEVVSNTGLGAETKLCEVTNVFRLASR